MKRAENLADVIRLFDPRKPLSGEALKTFYIDRPDNPLEQMLIYLQGLGLYDQPVKLLFTGHVGSGKSTELNQLAIRLKKRFFIVNLDIQHSLNPSELSYIDLLLGLSNALFRRATEEDVLAKAPAQITADAWETVHNFIENTILGPGNFRLPESTADFSTKVNLLAVEFEAKFSQETSTRKIVRDRMQGHVTDLVEKMDFVSRQVRKQYKRPVLFFIEGTDKLNQDKAHELFVRDYHPLTAFQATAIYTFPIGLHYSPESKQIKDHFNDHFVLPNIKVTERDENRSEWPEGIAYLRRAIELRANLDLFTPQALDTIIRASGGLMRTLVRLVQGAAVYALSTNEQRITLQNAQSAINKERADYIATLSTNDYTVLAERMADRRLSSDEAVQRLLQSHALMEYANDTPWCDVHPIIRGLVQERTKKREEETAA